MILSLIAAVSQNFGLGKNNQLLCHLPADLAYFKSITMHKPIIMGHKTFASIGKPLPGRLNIVLSHQPQLYVSGVSVFNSLSAALQQVSDVEEVMIIGGAQLFSIALPYAQKIYLTHIHHEFDADVFFPTLLATQWHCVHKVLRQHDKNNAYDLTFCHYVKI